MEKFLFNNWLISGKGIGLKEAKDFVSELELLSLDDFFENPVLKKSKKEKEIIDLFNTLLAEEIESLGLEYEPIDYYKIKFLGEEEFDLLGINDYSATSPSHNHIVINAENFYMKKFPVFLYKSILHEMIIFSSFREYKYSWFQKGFEISQVGLTKRIDTDLSGVNKGIVDLLVLRIFSRHEKKIENILGFNLFEEIERASEELVFFYPQTVFLDVLINKKHPKKEDQAEAAKIFYHSLLGIFMGENKFIQILEDLHGNEIVNLINHFGIDAENDLYLLRKFSNDFRLMKKISNELSFDFITDLKIRNN